MIRDFYHRYTVDEHTMVAMEKLWHPDAPFADLLSEVTEPGALVLAALFHDAGKGSPGGTWTDRCGWPRPPWTAWPRRRGSAKRFSS